MGCAQDCKLLHIFAKLLALKIEMTFYFYNFKEIYSQMTLKMTFKSPVNLFVLSFFESFISLNSLYTYKTSLAP